MTYKENITAILECCFAGFKEEIIEAACNRILGLKPKTGHWIRVDKTKVKCSACEVIHMIAQYPNGKIDWCPNCGAKMIEQKESNDEKTIIEADKVERTNEEQVLNGFYEMMKGFWGNQDLKMPNSVSERPPADVVESSKIDKAIAEIEDYTVEDNCEDGVMFALETLKRCLKEKRR